MSTTFNFFVAAIVLFSSSYSMAYVECTSREKNVDQTSQYVVKYFKPGQRPDVKNTYANVQLIDNKKPRPQHLQPMTFTLCLAKSNVYGTLVTCESAMGSAVSLLIQSNQKTGAYQDGPFKLFNLSCRDI
jgi:hypothetical protein